MFGRARNTQIARRADALAAALSRRRRAGRGAEDAKPRAMRVIEGYRAHGRGKIGAEIEVRRIRLQGAGDEARRRLAAAMDDHA